MLREASVYDIPRINELGKLLHENFSKVNNISEMLEDKYSKVVVYEKGDKVVGFIMATDLGETCDILDIVVDPEYRKQKIASNLITYLISDLSEELKMITLEVSNNNEAALKLYERFGFEIINVRKKYYSNGDDAYLMARRFM
ncbi:MAG: ribosomal-protein-alanine N-acetyltransferase [Firmicutes bacterium]|nr:ribosomal-protein-alanine N-acetyltransferase [Bacillota bacterium]